MEMMQENNKSNGTKEELIRVENLYKYFPVHGGVFQRVIAWVKAVEDVSFFIYKGDMHETA